MTTHCRFLPADFKFLLSQSELAPEKLIDYRFLFPKPFHLEFSQRIFTWVQGFPKRFHLDFLKRFCLNFSQSISAWIHVIPKAFPLRFFPKAFMLGYFWSVVAWIQGFTKCFRFESCISYVIKTEIGSRSLRSRSYFNFWYFNRLVCLICLTFVFLFYQLIEHLFIGWVKTIS